MTDKESINRLLRHRAWTKLKLAERSGLSPVGISGHLNRGKNSMRFDKFHAMVNAMEFDIVLRDRHSGVEFVVDMVEETVCPID